MMNILTTLVNPENPFNMFASEKGCVSFHKGIRNQQPIYY